MIIDYIDRLVIREFPHSSTAKRIEFYLATLHLKREIDMAITNILNKIK